MDDSPDWHVFHRHRVTRLDVRTVRRNDRIAFLQPLRCQDIRLFAIFVFQKRDKRRPVRVVFNTFHGRGRIELRTLEIDNTV